MEKIHGQDWLGFAGMPSSVFRAIPREQQFAEKLHAYTLPRGDRPNSRVRDLVDMILLVRDGLDLARLKTAIDKTFGRRKTHDIPVRFPQPPATWDEPFTELARECRLSVDMAAAVVEVSRFLGEIRKR